MKRIILFIVMVGFLFSGIAWAGPPQNGKIADVQGKVEAPPFEVTAINPSKNAIQFKFPIRSDQYETDKDGERLPQDPQIQVYASYAYAQNGKWVLTGSDDFRIETGALSNDQVEAYMSFPDQGSGWFWVRTWAKDSESSHWVWIDESSSFCRYDDEGNPGYEFIVNPETGEHQPVPQDYQTRD